MRSIRLGVGKVAGKRCRKVMRWNFFENNLTLGMIAGGRAANRLFAWEGWPEAG